MNKNLPSLVDGVQGKAARFDEGQVLVYAEHGNLDKRRGAIAMWIQTPVNSLGEPGMKYGLFREEATGKDKLNTMEWLLDGDWEMRFHPHAIKEYLHIIEVREWRKGDWRHLIINWDADKGDLFAYLDGRPGTWACGSGLYWSYDPEPWKPVEHSSFMLGAFSVRGDSPWRGAIDEVKIFDRPLTPAEAREEFLHCGHFSVLVRPLDRYLYAGTLQMLWLEFENQTDQAAHLAPRYEIKDANGAVVLSGVASAIVIPSGGIGGATTAVTLPAPGDYDMTVLFPLNGKDEKRVLGLKGLPLKEGLAPGKESEVLVAKVDAVAPPKEVESAPSRVVDSPIGPYREAGAAMHSRFAIPFAIEQIGAPHMAVIRYPDDKPRSMEVVLQNLDGVEDRQLQTAFATGDEYPLSNSMIEQRLLFWPKSKHYSLIFMTLEDGYPAAVQSFEIRRLDGGLSRGAVANSSFKGSVPARSIGMYFEDPVLPKNFGASAGFPGFARTVDRALDYLEWFGQDLLVYPVAWYRGPLYASRVEPNSPVAATRPHPPDFPQYLLKRMNARGMKLLPVFAIHEFPSLTPLAITDMKRVAAGEDTIMNVRRDDKLDYKGRHPDDPDFNCLDARIQQKVKDLVAEFLDRFGDEPALTGLMLLDARHKLFKFGSADSGYNDCNLRRFQEEAGVRIPVGAKDPKRFSKSYEWLRATAWEKWLDWRCRKIHDYYMEIAKLLAARRPDLKLVIGILPRQEGAREQSEGQGQYLPGGSVIGQMAREAGIDPSLFKNDSGVEFNFLPRMGSLRFLRSRGKSLEGLPDSRTVMMAPEIAQPLRDVPAASYTLFDRYWEDAIGANEPLDLSPISAGARADEVTWRVSTLNPNSFHCLENYVAGLGNLDALSLAKGGFVVGTLGTEPYVAQFAQAYRALPAVKFDDVEGLADPVRVRQKTVGGCNYFYVLNRLPAPVEARLKMASAEAVADLVSGEIRRGESMTLRLEPYQLRSFRCESPAARVAGGSVQIPDAFRQSLAKRLDEAARGLEARHGKGQDIAADAPYLDYARKLWTDGQYARLYFLLQESWTWSGLPQDGKEAAAQSSSNLGKWKKKK